MTVDRLGESCFADLDADGACQECGAFYHDDECDGADCDGLGETMPLAEAFDSIAYPFPSWRDVPEPLGQRAAAILSIYERAEKQIIGGGMGAASEVGIGYREAEAIYRYHGISDPAVQDLLFGAFAVIARSRSEGSVMGHRELEARRKAAKGGK